MTWPSMKIDPGKVRVGMLAPCLIQGGAEAWMVALARHLDLSRIAWVGTAIAKQGRTDPAMVSAIGQHMPVAQGRGAMRAIAASCDVLVTWAIDGLPEILAGIPLKPKVISAIHAPIESEWGQTVYARPGNIDQWVGVSELALDALPAASRSAAPSSVIWNCVDTDRMVVTRDRAEMRARWGVPADAPLALFLQRLADEKDAPSAARLAAHLPEPWHVVVVGDGDVRLELERLKAEWQLDRLHLVGTDHRAGEVLNAADVFVACSSYESFCLSMAEAIVAGVPVVSTEVGIAKLVSGITRVVPLIADGEILAREVIAAHAEGQRPAAIELRPRLMPERFGREWTDLIASLARPKVGELLQLARGRRECPHSSKADCGCADLVACGFGKGRDGLADRETCYSCLRSEDNRIHGQIHVARIGEWRRILTELIGQIEAAGLHKASATVEACACGPPGDFPWPSWMQVVELGPDFALGECPTLRRLWDRAKASPHGRCWYIHVKGASHGGNPNVEAWRRYLSYFIIDQWRDSVRALNDHDLAGADWINRGDPWWEPNLPPNPAFIGNFWWARMDYLARLPEDRVDLSRTRWSAEWDFVGMGDPPPRVKCFHTSDKNLYLHEIRPEEYRIIPDLPAEQAIRPTPSALDSDAPTRRAI